MIKGGSPAERMSDLYDNVNIPARRPRTASNRRMNKNRPGHVKYSTYFWGGGEAA